MPNFEVDFEYTIREYGSVTVPADNAEDAELRGTEYVKETFVDIDNIEITGVRELNG
jgi:hypothetical protein